MSIVSRIRALFGHKSSPQKLWPGASASDCARDSSGAQLSVTEAQLKQQAAVQKMRRGVADVSVSRQRLDLQRADLQKALDALTAQAERSKLAGDEGAAQTALGRHHIMGEQMADLISQRDALAEQETMLIAALTQLQARVSGFNVTAETLKAAHTSADAHQSIAKALRDFDEN
ncbi:PspA/IM30 family protein [Arthrobacter psychrochitiniphilus]|uniref:PspA/IM30 family protein n=1 Tax=Arthrobacter psychrochitiniphilus TaxID=291045 RepID=UPI003F7B76DD